MQIKPLVGVAADKTTVGAHPSHVADRADASRLPCQSA
jgi:hypothetical protein